MKGVHIVVGVLAIGLTSATAVYGVWCYWLVRESRWFWILLRASQVAVVVEVALGGVLEALGHHVSSLHLVYGLLPLAVSFLAEQLRLASAQMVLDSRGYASADEVGELPDQEQRGVVLAILQRELGVMTLAAGVMIVLLARAAGTA